MNIEIANRLVTLRKQYGYSQEELAGKIGISRQAVSKWERAESSPDTDNLIALSRLYQVSLDELLYTQEIQDSPKEILIYEPENIIEPVKRKFNMFLFPYPVVATILFLLIGFFADGWSYAWVIYLTVPVYYGIAKAVN